MNEQKYPPGWDEKRVQDLIAFYDGQTDSELAAADDAAAEAQNGQSVIVVPDSLLPAIRQLLATHKSA